ncbi:glycosyltransferase [Desulfatiferula olefinivorans]
MKNAVKLYYPVEESIRSILPICDEFIIAVGRGEDNTREVIEAIGDPKIRIIDTEWNSVDVLKKLILAQQTNVALAECTGDWCFYVQADEVVHEDDLPKIQKRCERHLDDPRIEGLLFDYLHFWGDYHHYQKSHGWYPREIRIVRNNIGVTSVRDAQSFRLGDGKKLTVAPADARIFHYGCVRPPYLMQNKQKSFRSIYDGKQAAEKQFEKQSNEFDYGEMKVLPRYNRSHPAVMRERIEAFNWGEKLRDEYRQGERRQLLRKPHKHERLKNRVLTSIEQSTGLDFNHKNWKRLLNR